MKLRTVIVFGRLTWNLMGMMNNPHYRVKVHVDTTASGQMAMRFEHPTKSGSEAGGSELRSPPFPHSRASSFFYL